MVVETKKIYLGFDRAIELKHLKEMKSLQKMRTDEHKSVLNEHANRVKLERNAFEIQQKEHAKRSEEKTIMLQKLIDENQHLKNTIKVMDV